MKTLTVELSPKPPIAIRHSIQRLYDRVHSRIISAVDGFGRSVARTEASDPVTAGICYPFRHIKHPLAFPCRLYLLGQLFQGPRQVEKYLCHTPLGCGAFTAPLLV